MLKNEKYILIVGLGKSGASIARFLQSNGENIVATDIDPLRADIGRELENIGIKTEIGYHNIETFENAEKIIVSPGIALDNKYLSAAAEKGVPISGELDIAAEFIDIPVLAITGTNGKTTVTTLASEMLRASGLKVFTCGNIGTPIVDYLMGKKEADVIVVEVSSFQLDTSDKFSPDVGVLLNITEDHIDRYEDFSAYSASKWSLFKNQTIDNVAIINASIKGVDKHLADLKSVPVFFGIENHDNMELEPKRAIINSDKIIINNIPDMMTGSGLACRHNECMDYGRIGDYTVDISRTPLKGWHNKENIAAASLACISLGGSIEGIETAINAFSGLSHRIEYAGTLNGVDYIDDSKATNPDAVVKALESFNNDIILILGGRSKGTDFCYMADAVKKRVKKIIAMGESRKEINQALSVVCGVLFADSMKDAVDIAYETALPGDVVLLSPACSSFDMYDSYAERGDDFVFNLKAKKQEIRNSSALADNIRV